MPNLPRRSETLFEKDQTGDRDSFDDAALVEGLRTGSARHADHLVRTHIGPMRAVARRILGGDAFADDCVQEAFLKAFRKIDGFEGRSSLKTWLHRITVNEALMKLRALKRLDERPIDLLMPEFDENACRIEAAWPTLATTEDILERESTRALVTSKIRELPDSYRIVLLLRDIEELDTAEVAKLLDITQGNVKVRLHRARSALKKLLEPVLRGEVE
ncbi:MAG: sigma-70 family RNA polymerase sigma factor [Inquilinus sp.]|nr:sigma-70 family RNA polymerase sigma factor [Inquilinus sp.]